MLKSILWLITVVPFLLIFKLAAVLLGLILVPIGLIKPKIIDNPEPFEGRTVDQPWNMVHLQPQWIQSIWGSDKYGAEGNWFWNDDNKQDTFWKRFKWLAIRNPVSNLDRKVPWMKIYDIKGVDVSYVGDQEVNDVTPIKGIQYAWYKQYGGLRIVKDWGDALLHIRIGYKLEPTKAVGNASLSTMIGLEWKD